MKVYDSKLGRLGNAIFRYFASSLFCILYDAKRTYSNNEQSFIFNDDMFIDWMEKVNNDIIPNLPDYNFIFYGFYQHDKIFIKFKNEILLWMNTNQYDLVYTDGNENLINNYNYPSISYTIGDLVNIPNNLKLHDIVLHLRLEDFITINQVIHPNSIKKLIELLNIKNFCIVVNKPKTELEQLYLNYITKDYNVFIQSGSVIEDFHIIKNSKILICSCSTLCWSASLLSTTLETVYFPNKKIREKHQTFCKPIDNTIYYDYDECSKTELENLLLKSDNILKSNNILLKSDNLFDIVIPFGPNDKNKLDIMIEYTKKNIIGYRNIYIVSYDKNIIINNCIIVDENIFPFTKNTISEYLGENNRNGWYLQQLIKLYSGFIIENILDNYLVIDCDTIFLKPIIFFDNNIPIYNYGQEYHYPYFEHMKKLHPSLVKYDRKSGICHHMILQKNILLELFNLIENYHKKLFYVVLLENIDKKEILGSGCSEYEIYFNYLQIYHKNKFYIRELNWANIKNIPTDSNYDYVSCHWYL